MVKTRDKEKTIEAILQSAITLFTKKGFIDTSTKEIAKGAHVAHGTIFYYFPTRSELIIESIYKAMEPLAMRLNEESRTTDDIEELCTIFLNEIDTYKPFYSRLVQELPLLPIKIRRMVFASMSGFSVHFVDVIERAQKNGKLHSFTPRVAVFYWFGMVHYLYSYPELLNTEKTISTYKKELIAFFTRGLGNQNISNSKKSRSRQLFRGHK